MDYAKKKIGANLPFIVILSDRLFYLLDENKNFTSNNSLICVELFDFFF